MIEATPAFTINLTIVTLCAFTVGMVLEMFSPVRKNTVTIGRWLNNGGLGLLSYVCNHLLGTLLGAVVLVRFGYSGSGMGALPLWANVILVFVLVEFMRWAVHVAMHKVPLLWRLHAVHHADKEIDISTSFRHHPLEAALTAIPMTLLVLLLSAPPEALVLYRACDLVMTVIAHTNTRLPQRLERWLAYLVVTPAFHRTHHMAERRHTDSNYGMIIPWFDYLFSTYQPMSQQKQESAVIGLDKHTVNEQRLDGMIIAPFVKRR